MPLCQLPDEPTSGLDSRNQEEVIAFLRELANGGCTVVTTIHSPSSGVYAQFDSILLLVRNIGIHAGSVAFQGSVGEQLALFASLGAPLPPFANPAEHALACLDMDHAPLSLPTVWRLRRLHLLYQTLPPLGGADAAVVGQYLRALLRLAAHCITTDGEQLDAPPPDADRQIEALAGAITQGGGSFIAFLHAMLACSLAAQPGDAAALSALGLPNSSAAAYAVARVDDVARRMAGCHAFTQLHAAFAAAVARRMDIAAPMPTVAGKPNSPPSSNSAPQSAVDKAAARATDQAARLKRAYDTGGWAWSLPAADATEVLCALGYDRVMGLAPEQAVAFVDTVAVQGVVSFGDLTTALYAVPSRPLPVERCLRVCLHARRFMHAHPVVPSVAVGSRLHGDAMRSFVRTAFPAGLRLDGAELSEPQLAGFERLLDFDGDGAVTQPDVARWLQCGVALRSALGAEPPPVIPTAGAKSARDAHSWPEYANSGFTQWRLLIGREFKMLAHDKVQLFTIVLMSILITLFLGGASLCGRTVTCNVGGAKACVCAGMYWRINQKQANFTNLVAALFLSCLFAGVLPLNITMMTFPRQVASQWCAARASAHAAAFCSASMPS